MIHAHEMFLPNRAAKARSGQALRRGCLLAAAAIVAVFGLYLGWLQWTGNVHEVLPGRFYRSAQMNGVQLQRFIDGHRINTVINLRGPSPGAAWYDDELAASREAGIDHVDFPMSANRRLTREESLQLVALLREAKEPILVHCKNGADRTGLAAVMYLHQVAGIDEDTAEWQLTPLFGHLNIPFTGPYAMDDSWEDFEQMIGLSS